MITLITVMFSLSFMLLCYNVINSLLRSGDFISRVAIYTGQKVNSGEDNKKSKDNYHQGLNILAKGIERMGILDRYKASIRGRLIKASVMMKPEEYLSICLLLFVFFSLFVFLFSGHFLSAFLSGIAGWFLPALIIRRKRARRIKMINSQLGDTLAIISNALKAGHSFFQAIDSVSNESTGPIAFEFGKLQKEISLGVTTEQALENLVRRVGSDDLELMVTAVLIQRQIGGNLAEILDNISGTIRQRIRIKGEIKAMTAQGRMSGWIIALLPFGLAGVVSIINPAQMSTLITDPLGIAMIGIAILMETIGIFFVKKVITIEV